MTTGISYSALLQTEMWRRKREQILKRDQNSCRNCGGNTGLQVHHRQYHISRVSGEFKHPWEYPSKLLVTLCQKCHEAGHKQYNIPSFKH